MSTADRIVYLNGQYLPRPQATLDLEDRAALFADGVYDVTAYIHGRPLAMDRHLARFRRSLAGIELPPTLADGLDLVSDELVRRNFGPTGDATVYWQVSRGAGPREHFPSAEMAPTVMALAYPAKPWDLQARGSVPTIKAILAEDQRWSRCDLKTLMLLPNILALAKARRAGCSEAVLHRDGMVTECCRTSLLIVRGSELWTHPADRWILGGITREILLEQAPSVGLTPVQRPFSLQELASADEVLITGTGSRVQAVTHVDDRPIGNGQAGPATGKLYTALMNYARRTTRDDRQ
ncbi:MAG: aminotransferase class IV [Phycisphaeraceae bacterium]|nr:aminotransferase class IV [Phycisphaeraceae bacterium]